MKAYVHRLYKVPLYLDQAAKPLRDGVVEELPDGVKIEMVLGSLPEETPAISKVTICAV